jgi:hypothetical protein
MGEQKDHKWVYLAAAIAGFMAALGIALFSK